MKGDAGGQYVKEGILRRHWRRGIKMTIKIKIFIKVYRWGEQKKRELDWRDCWEAE